MQKPTVLHFRNTFLRPSETFIARVVLNHQRYRPLAVGIYAEDYLDRVESEMFSGSKLGLAKSAVEFFMGHSPKDLSRIIEKHDAKLIHAHFGQDAYIMVPSAKQHGIPLVVSFYGKDVTQLPKQWIWRKRYKSVIAGSTLVVAASEKMKRQLVQLGFDKKKIRIVRFGLDMDTFNWSMPKSNGKIMMIGRFVEKKGMRYAIESMAKIKQSHPDASLDIYGDGVLAKSFKSSIEKLGLLDQVKLHGFVPSEKVSEVMKNYDILLVPSVTASNNDQEGLPNVIIEGMATGLAVVASDHAAIPEIVIDGETGILTEEKNPDSIASAIATFLDKSKMKESCIRAARDFVEREHDLKKTIADLESIYDESCDLLGNK